MMAALCNMGRALRYADPDMRAECSIVKAAVSNCGNLGADRQVVIEAVSVWPDALHYAYVDLRADPQVVTSRLACLHYANERICT